MLILADDVDGIFTKPEIWLVIASTFERSADDNQDDSSRVLIASGGSNLLTVQTGRLER